MGSEKDREERRKKKRDREFTVGEKQIEKIHE
jgi:hypothetical protein